MEKSNNKKAENKTIPYDKEFLCFDAGMADWLEKQGDKIVRTYGTFETNYHNLIRDKTYFLGCPIHIYKDTYESRLKNFISRMDGTAEIDFIKNELNKTDNILLEYSETPHILNTHIFNSIRVSIDLRNEYLKERANELGYKISQNTESRIYSIEPLIIFDTKSLSKLEKQEEKPNSIHPKHDPNLWNKEAYELFKYLYDNYYLDGRQTRVKLSSIWHFFNDHKHSDKIKKPKYNLHATKDEYKSFIKREYEIKITNMDKKNSYYNLHYPTITGHLEKFEKD